MSGDNNSAVLNVQSQCDGVMMPDDHERRRGDGFGGGLAVTADIPRFVADLLPAPSLEPWLRMLSLFLAKLHITVQSDHSGLGPGLG